MGSPTLLIFPLGTIVAVYFLVILLHPKGGMLFSREYAEVLRFTDDVDHSAPRINDALSIGVVLLYVAPFAYAFFTN